MSEKSMDKKKKNEDEKEVIDFMELVEENLSTMGGEKNEISKNDVYEDPIENDLFENKPLQDTEEKKEFVVDETKEFVVDEKKEFEVDEKKEFEVDEKKEFEVDENKPLQNNEEKMEFEGSDEDFMVGRSSSEAGDIITEDILEDLKKELIKEDSYEDDRSKDNIHEDLKNLNKHIKQMAIEPVSEKKASSNIILRKDDTLEIRTPFHKENIRIHKYPGFLYINIYAIEKYISSDTDVQSVFIRMETDNFVYETDDYKEDSNIRLNSLVHLNLSTSKNFRLRFIMNKRTHHGTIKSCECVVDIDREFLDKIHNALYEVSHEWTAYSSSNIIKNFLSFFTYSVADAYSLKLYFSFISEEEFKVIGVPIPNSLYDLGRWLKIRKHAYNTWFSGFCNIRGNITNICTHLWKRRFIKIYGYKVYIFNEHTKNLMGIFNLINTMTKGRQIFEEDNKVKIVSDGNQIEFHFESNEKYSMFRNVLEALI